MISAVSRALIAGVIVQSALWGSPAQSKPVFEDIDPASEDFPLAEQQARNLLERLNTNSPPLERITRYRVVRFDAQAVRELFDQLANTSGMSDEDRQPSIKSRTELSDSFEIELFPGSECIVKSVTEAKYLDSANMNLPGEQKEEGAWIYVSECEGRPLWAVQAVLRHPDGWVRFDLRQHYRDETDSTSLSIYDGPVITLQALLGTSYAFVFEDRGVAYILVERPE